MRCPRCGSREFRVIFICSGVGEFEERGEKDMLIVKEVDNDKLFEMECLKCGIIIPAWGGVTWEWREAK